MGKRLGLVLATLLLASPVLGAGMQVEAGKWQFQSTAEPALGAGDGEATTSCMQGGEMTPEVFMKEAPECTVKDAQSDSGSMSWSLACPGAAGGGMTGDARFTSSGDTIEGTMNMHVRAGGMKMTMKRKWKGKRLGPCD